MLKNLHQIPRLVQIQLVLFQKLLHAAFSVLHDFQQVALARFEFFQLATFEIVKNFVLPDFRVLRAYIQGSIVGGFPNPKLVMQQEGELAFCQFF